MTPTQSIPNGTMVKLDFRLYISEMIGEEGFKREDNGKIFQVESLETYSELGNKDFEFYNIINPENNQRYTGVSGYHLSLIPNIKSHIELVLTYESRDVIRGLINQEIANIRPVLIHLEHQFAQKPQDRIIDLTEEEIQSQITQYKWSLHKLNNTKTEFDEFCK